MTGSSQSVVRPAFPQLLLRLGSSSFVLSLGWEWGQLSAYRCPAGSLAAKLGLLVPAALGDVALTFALVLMAVAAHRRPACPLRFTRRRALAFIVGGAGLGILVELVALAADAWSYLESMPLLPGLQVGWLPVLFLMTVPLLAATLACPARIFSSRRPERT